MLPHGSSAAHEPLLGVARTRMASRRDERLSVSMVLQVFLHDDFALVGALVVGHEAIQIKDAADRCQGSRRRIVLPHQLFEAIDRR